MKNLIRCCFIMLSVIILFQVSVSALEAPYLIAVTAQSEFSVELKWRNNDIATEGFLIERKSSSESIFTLIDSVYAATILSYIDSKNLKPNTLYTYRLKAFNTQAVSDTSNHLEITTLAAKLQIAAVEISWNTDTSHSVQITIYDSSRAESGFRIYRSHENTPFTIMATITNNNPVLIWYDTSVQQNTWYSYKICTFSETDSLFSDTFFTYTLKNLSSTNISEFTKIADFPISISGWSAKTGDSIILKESNSPDGKFSVINIKDPANPRFSGYIDTNTLISYPVETLIPVFLKFGIQNTLESRKAMVTRDHLLLLSGDRIIRYKKDASFTIIDTLITGYGTCDFFLMNDSMICFTSRIDRLTNSKLYSFAKMTISGFFSFKEKFSDYSGGRMGHYFDYWINPLGFLDNNTLIITSDSSISHMGQTTTSHTVFVYNTDRDNLAELSTTAPFSYTRNLGYYLSPKGFIAQWSTSGHVQLYISTIDNPNGYQTALHNDALYADSTIPINSLRNILLDTVAKQVFLISDYKMTILRYSDHKSSVFHQTIGNVKPEKFLIAVPQNGNMVKFILPFSDSKPVELRIYDLSGRMLDKITTVKNTILNWKPTQYTTQCLVAIAAIGKERISYKFTLK